MNALGGGPEMPGKGLEGAFLCCGDVREWLPGRPGLAFPASAVCQGWAGLSQGQRDANPYQQHRREFKATSAPSECHKKLARDEAAFGKVSCFIAESEGYIRIGRLYLFSRNW